MINKDIPLVDLHRHLDGNVRLGTILDLARQHGLKLPADDLEGLRPYAQMTQHYEDLAAAFGKFELNQSIFFDYEAVRRVVQENVEDAVREGIDYIELRYSPVFIAEKYKLDPMSVASVVSEVWEEVRGRLPVKVNLIVILSRHYGPEIVQVELQAALANRSRGVVALDIAGIETNAPGSLFVDHCRTARENGLHLTVHAGEWSGPQSVRQAVEGLQAERIGHGVGAKDDPAVMDLIVERGVAVECCPTSSVQFSMVPTYQDHPLKEWLRRGMRVTIATDDPGISAIDLPHEYRVLDEQYQLPNQTVRTLQSNGVDAAFLTAAEKQALRELAARRV